MPIFVYGLRLILARYNGFSGNPGVLRGTLRSLCGPFTPAPVNDALIVLDPPLPLADASKLVVMYPDVLPSGSIRFHLLPPVYWHSAEHHELRIGYRGIQCQEAIANKDCTLINTLA